LSALSDETVRLPTEAGAKAEAEAARAAVRIAATLVILKSLIIHDIVVYCIWRDE
jgi:hypothetical protein